MKNGGNGSLTESAVGALITALQNDDGGEDSRGRFDGVCDEPNTCSPGTDAIDCDTPVRIQAASALTQSVNASAKQLGMAL